MINKPKRIGRDGENAVVSQLIARGAYPNAEPRALFGINDRGDVTGTRSVVFQVKSGKAAEQASLNQIRAWLEDTEKQRENAHGTHGVLVIKRAGVGTKRVGQWRAFTTLDTLDSILTQCGSGYRGEELLPAEVENEPAELTFDAMITLLQTAGLAENPLTNKL